MRADHLARGGKSASFTMGQSDSELAHDLKTLLPLDVQGKYGIGGEVYNELLADFMAGKELPNLSPSVEDVPEAKDEVVIPEDVPVARPQVGYKGESLGDTVLIQRVDKEHSSNLIIPDSLKAKSEIGYIISAGKLCKYVEEGWLILFDRFASVGMEISLIDEDGIERERLVVHEYDILLKLDKIQLE